VTILGRVSPAPVFDIDITTLKRIIPFEDDIYFRMLIDWLVEANA